MADDLLTTEDLADRLAVSPRMVVSWAKAGAIPEVRLSPRIRRFDYNEVVHALKSRRGRSSCKAVTA
jgi:excisionase family DNA binding protein